MRLERSIPIKLNNMKRLFAFITFLACAACTTEDPNHLLDLGEETPIEAVSYPHEVIMGNPRDISLINNNLYVFQSQGEYPALILDPEDGHLIEEWGERGNGPGEFGDYPIPWGKYKEKLFIHDQNRFVIHQYNIEKKDSFSNLSYVKDYTFSRLKYTFTNGIILENGNMVVSSANNTPHPLMLMNLQLDSLNNFGGIVPDQNKYNFGIFRSELASYGNTFVQAMKNFGYLACYEQTGEKDVTLKWEHYLQPLKFKENRLDESMKEGFCSIKMTKNYIFAVYKGCLPTDEKRIFNHILMFDHKGKLLRNFRVTNNDSLGRIEISEDEKTIYVSCYEPEPAILRIDISEYI